MTTYCPHCGYKNSYATAKPTKCQSCDDLLEPKPVVREKPVAKRRPGYDPIEVDEEGIGEESEGFDIAALKRSVKVEPDGNEGGFMTIGQIQKNGGSFARGGVPEGAAGVRDEVLGGLLGGKGTAAAPLTPPDLDKKPRSTARKQPSRFVIKE